LSGVETSFSDESGHFDSAQCPDLVNPEQKLNSFCSGNDLT
jgi:hypothetical protein